MFKSQANHLRFFYLDLFCVEKTKINKKTPGLAHFLKNIKKIFYIFQWNATTVYRMPSHIFSWKIVWTNLSPLPDFLCNIEKWSCSFCPNCRHFSKLFHNRKYLKCSTYPLAKNRESCAKEVQRRTLKRFALYQWANLFHVDQINISSIWAVVVVYWSACSLSIPTIRVRFPLKTTIFLQNCWWKERK